MSQPTYHRSTLVPVLGYSALALFLANFCVFVHKHFLPDHGHKTDVVCVAEGAANAPLLHLEQADGEATFFYRHQNDQMQVKDDKRRHHRRYRFRQPQKRRHWHRRPHKPKSLEIDVSDAGQKNRHIIIHTLDGEKRINIQLHGDVVTVAPSNFDFKGMDVELREYDAQVHDFDLELDQLEMQVKADLARINLAHQFDANSNPKVFTIQVPKIVIEQ